jgi:hypothetical protein
VTDPEIDIATTAIETIEEENLTEMIDATTVAVLVQRTAETATDQLQHHPRKLRLSLKAYRHLQGMKS